MKKFIRSLINRVSRATRTFFRRVGYITTNKMSLRSWLFTLFSLIGLLVSLGGYYWLDVVSKQYSISKTNAPLIEPIKLKPISDLRHDVDVVLAIDFSYSMEGDNGSDPNGLRLRAGEIMASSLAADIYPRHTRMGYIEFGSSAIEAQKMSLIDSNDARLQVIKAIYTPSPERKSDLEFGNFTNIGATLEMADRMLKEGNPLVPNQGAGKNTPALVLLTDGRPTVGYTSEARISDLVNNLVRNNTLIFMVVLRNPDKETSGDPVIEQEFENWRQLWFSLSRKYPKNVEYVDAQNDEQLEFIYNQIRSRLVQEGTKPGDRVLYDPLDPNSNIIMPPNLLQAQLIVSKPVGTTSIELIDSDGINFADQVANSSENDILDGNFFTRYKIGYPKATSWKLVTDTKKPLYYLLNTESIYSVRLAWPVGSPYLYKYRTSQVPLVISDEMGDIIDKPFNLNASILKSEQDETGIYVEKKYPLSEVHSDTVLGKTQYFVDVSPDDFSNESTVVIQVEGSATDGSLVNSATIKLPVIDAPSGLNDQTSSVISETCLVAKKVFWPPSLICENKVDLSVQIEGGDLLKGETVVGKLYSPLSDNPVDMELENNNTLNKVLGSFQFPGTYQLLVDIGGDLKQQESDFQWHQQINKTVKIEIPGWVEEIKSHCLYAAVLFLICMLWKIIIVPILLLAFSLFLFAPDGSYSIDLSAWPSVFKTAMERRKLFTLTFGYARKVNDLSNSLNVRPPFIRNGLLKLIHRYLHSSPRAHIFWIPLVGLYGEDDHGTWSKADTNINTMISAGQSRIYIKG